MSAGKLVGLFAFSVLTFIAGCASEVPEEEVGESEDRLIAGRRLTPSEIAGHLRAVGFPEDQIGRMVCTAKYESSFYDRASNQNRNGTIDRGLFQINSVHLGSTRGCPSRANSNALWDPRTNARCALAIFELQGNRAWYGYRAHRTECDRFPAPASSNMPAGDDDDAPAENEEEGGCWSGTLQDMVDARTCVQSRSNQAWFQCMNGTWHRGGDAESGRFGACQASHPL